MAVRHHVLPVHHVCIYTYMHYVLFLLARWILSVKYVTPHTVLMCCSIILSSVLSISYYQQCRLWDWCITRLHVICWPYTCRPVCMLHTVLGSGFKLQPQHHMLAISLADVTSVTSPPKNKNQRLCNNYDKSQTFRFYSRKQKTKPNNNYIQHSSYNQNSSSQNVSI